MSKCDSCKANRVCDHNKYGFDNCENYISEDVVEVVRCKDCIHYCIENADGGKFCEILYYESPIESGYCCYGEARNGE